MEGNLFRLSVDDLRRTKRFVVDTSSVIIMADAGFLDHALREKTFFAPPGVMQELGAIDSERYPEIRSMSNDAVLYEGFTVDAQVVVAARQLELPVVTDDFTLLGRALDEGVPGYTSRVILEALLLEGVVDLAEYNELKRSLSGLIRYAVPLYLESEELHWAIRKEIG